MRTGIGGVTHEIHENLDPLVVDPLRRRVVGNRRKVDEVVATRLEPLPHGAPVIRSIGEEEHFKAVPVVQFEDFRRQIGDRMPMEIAREISQAYA